MNPSAGSFWKLARVLIVLVVGAAVVRTAVAGIRRRGSSQQVQELKKQLEQVRQSYEKQIEEAQAVRLQLTNDLALSREEIQQLVSSAPHSAQKGQLKQTAELTQRIKVLTQMVKEKEEVILHLTRLLERMDKKRSKMEKEIADREGLLQQREMQLTILKQKWEAAQAQVQHLNPLLEKERREYQRKVDTLQKSLVELKATQREMEQQLRAHEADKKEYNRLRAELAAANDRIAELIVSLDQQEKLTAQLTDKGLVHEGITGAQ